MLDELGAIHLFKWGHLFLRDSFMFEYLILNELGVSGK